MSVPIQRILSVILSYGRSNVRVGIDCQPPKTAIIKNRESGRAVERATADRRKTKSNLIKKRRAAVTCIRKISPKSYTRRRTYLVNHRNPR